jgi:adenosylhomocysteine nucleosidase
VRVVIICPIPLEFTTCRTHLSLRDGPVVLGCRTCQGTIANVDVIALEAGPAKARAAAATLAGITQFQPELVLDTGTCGALDGELIVDTIVLALSCLEFDISGTGLPRRVIPEMRLPSSFSFMPKKDSEKLVRKAVELGKELGFHVRSGIQACGEYFFQSTQVRESIFALTGALSSNWETAGVFIGSLRARVPALSFRIVTDLGDEDSLRDFKKNARRCSEELYRYMRSLMEAGWFADFQSRWKQLTAAQVQKVSQMVLP